MPILFFSFFVHLSLLESFLVVFNDFVCVKALLLQFFVVAKHFLLSVFKNQDLRTSIQELQLMSHHHDTLVFELLANGILEDFVGDFWVHR